MRVIRRLFTWRWLGALVAALLYGFAAYHLGHWQYAKHVAKVERNDRLDARFAADPVPLPRWLGIDPMTVDQEWTRITVTGHYADTGQLLVRNRVLATEPGFEVVAPFEPDAGGPVLLVDRGFVVAPQTAATDLPTVPPAPTGPVTVVGWLRVGELERRGTAPRGQLASVNLAEAAGELGRPVLGAWLVLDSENDGSGTAPPRPAPLEAPDRSLGPHQAYAWQWWMTIPLGLVLIFFGLRREGRPDAADAAVGSAPGGGAGEGPPRPVKQRKKRIWDDEDDDE